MYRQRWHSNPKGVNGSTNGLEKLPKRDRRMLYRYLAEIVGPGWAHRMRDWRPTKIIVFLENQVAG